jgi:hypothetical protein
VSEIAGRHFVYFQQHMFDMERLLLLTSKEWNKRALFCNLNSRKLSGDQQRQCRSAIKLSMDGYDNTIASFTALPIGGPAPGRMPKS